MGRFGKLWQEEEGAAAVEYSLLLAFIALVIIGAVSLLGQAVNGIFGKAAAQLS